MSIASNYYDHITKMLTSIVDTQQEQIEKAAKILAKAVSEGKLINVIGPGGHSNMAVEEVLWRAGGLVHVNPILDPGTNIIHGAKRSNIVERTPGYAKAVLDAYRVSKGDVLVIVNAYGINAMTIDTALLCKERGITSIGITSTSYASVPKDAPSRHPSGLNLCDLVDVYIDNKLPHGDAVIEIDGLAQKMGSTSTYANCFTMNVLMMETAKALTEMGIQPAVWMSANLPGGDESNRKFEEELLPKIRHL